MSSNPFKAIFDWLFPVNEGKDDRGAGAGRRCEAGHWMDPTWVECPYCKAEREAGARTPRRRTVVDHPAEPGRAGGGDARRITGVLVTYSWHSAGQLFPVYEGKNLIGCGSAGSDGRPCEIQIAGDATLSHEHALIRSLGEDYEIFDQKSENGTTMNGQRVPVHGTTLEDRSIIRTGATVWTFLKIKAPAGSGGRPGAPEASAADGPRPSTRETTIAAAREAPPPAHGRETTIPQAPPAAEEARPREAGTGDPAQPPAEASARRPTTVFESKEEPPQPRGGRRPTQIG